MRLIDLSHTITPGMTTYPGLPGPVVTDHLSREASRSHYASGTTFHIARIEMVANTGTYMDAPSHRWERGADLSQLTLEQTANLEGVCVEAPPGGRAIDAEAFAGVSVRGRAVLVRTGWSRHFGTEAYGSGHPFLTAEATQVLVKEGAVLVGIDSLNIDDTAAGDRPAHTGLLGAGIPIVEHLTRLEQLPTRGFRFFSVAPKFSGVGTFPVRAFALVPEPS
ncbi:cyclase family protein [Hyalangium rubrum]|uniref:Cyclase family protein n=1 Tax=Hyalangium rubrum TaxID=3103134 RepID=A0ABU5H3D9_9BACT|nr:cyclase family protein [Hyalangium sp. s54d21]MDY7227895.1 cyclase family protein [Hyalangium sp. s54d21]